jgi:hypothetical protein
MYTPEATIDLRIVRAAGDSGEEPQRSLRCHFAFMSASAGHPRFFKASSTPSMSRSWILHLWSKATCGHPFGGPNVFD